MKFFHLFPRKMKISFGKIYFEQDVFFLEKVENFLQKSFSRRNLKISFKNIFPKQKRKGHSIKNVPNIPPLINLIYEIILINNQFRSHQE